MHKPIRRLVISLVVVAMIVAAAQMAFKFVAEQNRDATLAKLDRSTSFPAYKELASEISRRRISAPVSEPKPEDTSQPAVLPENVLDIAALLEQLPHLGLALPREIGEIVWVKKPSQWTAADVARLSAYWEANRDLTRQIRRLAGGAEEVEAVDYVNSVGEELLRFIDPCAQWLHYSAMIRAKAGDYAEAVEDIIAGMKLGDALLDVPISRSQSFGKGVYHQMCDAIEKSFSGGELSSDLISKLVTHMGQADNRSVFAESFIGDALTELQKFSEIRAADQEMREKLKSRLPSSGPLSLTTTLGQFAGPAYIRLYTSPLGRPWMDTNEGRYADIMARVAEAAELPYYEATPILSKTEGDFWRLRSRGVLARVRLSAPWGEFIDQARHEAKLDLAQIGLLIEHYRAEHGSYPDTMEAIASELSGDVPVDVFSGEPYRYKASEDSLLLYSVGPNGSDDGGISERASSKDDIAWRGEDER